MNAFVNKKITFHTKSKWSGHLACVWLRVRKPRLALKKALTMFCMKLVSFGWALRQTINHVFIFKLWFQPSQDCDVSEPH